MRLWSAQALTAYLVCALGIAGFDHLWAALKPDTFGIFSHPDSPDAADAAFAEMRAWSRLHPIAELAALVVVTAIATALVSIPRDGNGFNFILLTIVFATIGREVLGLDPGFTAPFFGMMTLAWLIVLCAWIAWQHINSRG